MITKELVAKSTMENFFKSLGVKNLETAINAYREFEMIFKKFVYPLLDVKCDEICLVKAKPHQSFITTESGAIYIHPSQKEAPFAIKLTREANKGLDNKNRGLTLAAQVIEQIMPWCPYFYKRTIGEMPYPNKKRGVEHEKERIKLYAAALEKGVGNFLGNAHMMELVDKLLDWSQKTYEREKMPFAFIMQVQKIGTGEVEKKPNYITFLQEKDSAVITDGIISYIELDSDGNIVSHEIVKSVKPSRESGYTIRAPYRYRAFADNCHNNKIGFVLQRSGDILVFKDRDLHLVKRNEQWQYVNHDRIIQEIKNRLAKMPEKEVSYIAYKLYLSLLDVSFAHAGGLLAVISDKEKKKFIETHVQEKDNFMKVCNENNTKIRTLKELIESSLRTSQCLNKNSDLLFHSLNPKLRLELLSLDGATILDKNGRLLATGAILKEVNSKVSGGARSAAAQFLAQKGNGIAIKVSMDGDIDVYTGGDSPLFSLLKFD